MKNRGKDASKEILAMWVSLGLQRALTKSNIEARFRATHMWLLNPKIVEKYLGPACPICAAEYDKIVADLEGTVDVEAMEGLEAEDMGATIGTAVGDLSGGSKSSRQSCNGQLQRPPSVAGITVGLVGSLPIEELLSPEGPDDRDLALDDLLDGRLPFVDPTGQHFVLREVQIPQNLQRRSIYTSSLLDSNSEGPQNPPYANDNSDEASGAAPPKSTSASTHGLNTLLKLPQLPQASRRTSGRREALINYSKSILLTSEQYVQTMQVKAKRKEEALIEVARWTEQTRLRRAVRELEKERKESEKVQKAAEAHMRENFHVCGQQML